MSLPEWCLVDVPVIKDTFGVTEGTGPIEKPTCKGIVSSGNATLIADLAANAYKKHDA